MQFIIFLTIFSSAFAMAGANTGFFPQIFDESKLAQFPQNRFSLFTKSVSCQNLPIMRMTRRGLTTTISTSTRNGTTTLWTTSTLVFEFCPLVNCAYNKCAFRLNLWQCSTALTRSLTETDIRGIQTN